MSENTIYPVSEAAAAGSHLNSDEFEQMYRQSVEDPEEFWAEQAGRFLHWHEPLAEGDGGRFLLGASALVRRRKTQCGL